MVSTDWFYTACRYTDGYIENAIRKPKGLYNINNQWGRYLCSFSTGIKN